jgi:hypothetical protein
MEIGEKEKEMVYQTGEMGQKRGQLGIKQMKQK